MFGLYLGIIILGISSGFIVTTAIVFYSVKNKATIIKVQLLGDKLDESTTMFFAVRRNTKDKIIYRCPNTVQEGLQVYFQKIFKFLFKNRKTWQEEHERKIIGKPVRASCVKIDDKIISCLHYIATKITFKEDCIDSMIIQAYEDSELALATIGAANNIQEEAKKKKKEDSKYAVKEVTDYLAFIKNSITDLNNQVISERQKRVYLSEQLLPLAQSLATEGLGVDIVALCEAANLPPLNKIVQMMTDDPKPNSKGDESFNKLLEKVDEKIEQGK